MKYDTIKIIDREFIFNNNIIFLYKHILIKRCFINIKYLFLFYQ